MKLRECARVGSLEGHDSLIFERKRASTGIYVAHCLADHFDERSLEGLRVGYLPPQIVC